MFQVGDRIRYKTGPNEPWAKDYQGRECTVAEIVSGCIRVQYDEIPPRATGLTANLHSSNFKDMELVRPRETKKSLLLRLLQWDEYEIQRRLALAEGILKTIEETGGEDFEARVRNLLALYRETSS